MKKFHEYSQSAIDSTKFDVRRILRANGPLMMSEVMSRLSRGMRPHADRFLALLIKDGTVTLHGVLYMAKPEEHPRGEFSPVAGMKVKKYRGVHVDLPTDYPPGSPEKVEILSARYFSGKPLWVQGDNPVPVPQEKHCVAEVIGWDDEEDDIDIL